MPAGQAAACFGRSAALYAGLAGFLQGSEAAGLAHEELEARLSSEGRELQRQLLQDHLELRTMREVRLPEVRDAGGAARRAAEAGHRRPLTTIFGTVQVTRFAYRAKGQANLHPADAALNIPAQRHSHGLRELAAVEASRGSYQEAASAISRATGVRLGKRQAEELTGRAAADFGSFYATQPRPEAEETDLLVISADGKGIVMRPGALRPGSQGSHSQAEDPPVQGRKAQP